MVQESAVVPIELAERPCPICKRITQQRVVREANLEIARLNEASFSSRKLPEYMHCRLMQCEACSLTYASPAPTQEYLAASYREASFDASSESNYAARTYAACLRRIGRLFPVPAVDIGAGDGAFIAELLAADFTDVVGYEPSMAPVAGARPDVRAHLRVEPFDASTLPNGELGLITCFQTIEHVYEPLTLVSDMHRLLRSGGTAFLIAHDIEALSARLMGYRSPIFDVEHLQLLSEKSAEQLMKAAGFRDVMVFPVVNSYPIAYWTRLFPFPDVIKPHLLRALSGRLSWLGRRLLSLPAGNLAIIATK